MATFEVYPVGVAGRREWSWRLRAANGVVLAAPPGWASFADRSRARRHIKTVCRNLAAEPQIVDLTFE